MTTTQHSKTSTILFTCPQCQALGRAKTEWAGKRIKCPRCNHESQIGGAEPTPATTDLVPPPVEQIETVHDLPEPEPAPAPVVRWEHRIVRHHWRDVLRLVDEINAMGEEGWECVGVLQAPELLLYKRAKR